MRARPCLTGCNIFVHSSGLKTTKKYKGGRRDQVRVLALDAQVEGEESVSINERGIKERPWGKCTAILWWRLGEVTFVRE